MLLESKDQIREIFRKKRAALNTKKQKLYSREIAKNFFANISIAPASTIAIYIPFEHEVDVTLLSELYAETGHTLCLPCVDEKDAPMVFRKYIKGTPLVKNRLVNIMEPPHNFPEVSPNVIIVPLIAFDSAGTRLGMGAGYYDRTFDYLSGFSEFIAIGVAFSCQQTPYIKPEAHDYKLDALVTEKKVFVFS